MSGTSITAAYRQLYRHIPASRQRELIWQMLLTLAGAAAELATIGAVIPFLSIAMLSETDARFGIAGQAIDAVTSALGLGRIAGAAVILVAVAIVAGALRLVLNWHTQRFAFGIGYDLSLSVYDRILHQPFSFHLNSNSSSILAGLTKVQSVISTVILPGIQAVTSVVVSVSIVAALIAIDATTAGLAIVGFGTIYVGVAVFTRRRLRRNSRIIAEAQTARLKAVQEGLGGIRDIILDRSQAIFLDAFSKVDRRLRTAQAVNQFIGTSPRYVVEAGSIVMIAAVAMVASAREGGLMTALPVLGAFAVGAQRLLPLIQQIYNASSVIIGSYGSLVDILGLLEQPDDMISVGPSAAIAFERDIRLEQVGFSYQTAERTALDGIDLTIVKGERIGFIGTTGSGKSTLVDLLMGLLQPSRGHILIDGVPLDPANIAAWQTRIAHVPQIIFLADAAVDANIAFGRDGNGLDPTRVRAAATLANADTFIAQMDQGYASRVGEKGVRISGGQRQRLGIARALYKHADVLILDEATSALDDATEAEVMANIESLESRPTVLIVAHRLSTLRMCDRIVRLDHGRIVEVGSYKEVIADHASVTANKDILP